MKINFTLFIICITSFFGCCKTDIAEPQTNEPTLKEKLYHYNKMIQIASLAEVRSGIYYDSLIVTNEDRFKDSVVKYNYIYEFTVFTRKP